MPVTSDTITELYLTHLKFIRKWVRLCHYQYRLDEDDLMSEANELFLKCLPKYDPSRPFLPWLKKRLIGGFLELARKKRRRERLAPTTDSDLCDVPAPDVEARVDEPVAFPTEDARRLAAETLRMSKKWFVRDAYHIRAELRRRLSSRSSWDRIRFNRAADAIAARLEGK